MSKIILMALFFVLYCLYAVLWEHMNLLWALQTWTTAVQQQQGSVRVSAASFWTKAPQKGTLHSGRKLNFRVRTGHKGEPNCIRDTLLSVTHQLCSFLPAEVCRLRDHLACFDWTEEVLVKCWNMMMHLTWKDKASYFLYCVPAVFYTLSTFLGYIVSLWQTSPTRNVM